MYNMMLRTFLFIFIFMYIGRAISEKKFGQQAGWVRCPVPEFATNCSAITRRIGRGHPYTTNITFTTLVAFGNNLTVRIGANYGSVIDTFSFKTTPCDYQKVDWLKSAVEAFSNFPTHLCPLPPGDYRLFNVEIPPKHFPLPLPKGRFEVKINTELTDTKMLVSEFHVTVINQ